MFSNLFADPDEENLSVDANRRSVVVADEYEFILEVAEDEFNANKKSLFATFIWSGSIKLAETLLKNRQLIEGKSVLEFGAAAGLPSLMCGRLCAGLVCSSDYPSKTVIDVLRANVNANCGNDPGGVSRTKHFVVEHIWGEDVSPLLAVNGGELYDVLLAAECLWKHESHEVFITSILRTIRKTGTLILSFSHHIQGLEACDLAFLAKLSAAGFVEHEHSIVPANHMWDTDRIVDMHIVVLVYGSGSTGEAEANIMADKSAKSSTTTD
jgi:predicted nicotinamide N-methyase